MRQALDGSYPGEFETSVTEPMLDYGFDSLDARHKRTWKRALGRPWTIVWGQRVIDSFPSLTRAFHRRLLREFARSLASELSGNEPALVVVNHGWLAVAYTMAQQDFGLDVPVVTFETSTMNANALWAEPQVERMLVASAISKRRLVRLGVPVERIDVVGYPVRAAFLCPPGKSAARAALGLEERFTCLVSLGGEGVGGSPERALGELLKNRDLQIVVIAGRNEELRRRLEAEQGQNPGLHVLGFVDRMAEYLAACDVVVGKSGPATAFETLAVGRPLLSPALFGSAENKMLEILERNGLGAHLPDPKAIARRVRLYQEDPASLAEIESKTRALDFPGMANRMARYLAHYARFREPAVEQCGRGLDERFLAQ